MSLTSADYWFMIFIATILLIVGGANYWFREYLRKSFPVINILLILIAFHLISIAAIPNTQSEVSLIDGLWIISIIVLIGWSIIAVIRDGYQYVKDYVKKENLN